MTTSPTRSELDSTEFALTSGNRSPIEVVFAAFVDSWKREISYWSFIRASLGLRVLARVQARIEPAHRQRVLGGVRCVRRPPDPGPYIRQHHLGSGTATPHRRPRMRRALATTAATA